MLRWQGDCIVHNEFKTRSLGKLIEENSDAAVLVHPESPEEIIALADVVGSTTQIINAAKELPNKRFIVATDNGIFYKMKQAAPDKIFMEAPSAGEGATCESCAHCPWMAMNHLKNLRDVLAFARQCGQRREIGSLTDEDLDAWIHQAHLSEETSRT